MNMISRRIADNLQDPVEAGMPGHGKYIRFQLLLDLRRCRVLWLCEVGLLRRYIMK